MVGYKRFAAALVLIATLSACSSSNNQPSSQGGNPTPSKAAPTTRAPAQGGGNCSSLASSADVSAIVGENVTGPTSASTNQYPGLKATSCHYSASDGTVGFAFGTGPDPTTVRTVFEQSKQSQGGVDVAGLGDSAYFSADQDNLLVIQGTTFLSVGMILSSIQDKTTERDAAIALAKKVLPQL
ncbi:MAG TPA: hypothetical protein VF660_05350 [Actinomycetota bacterium]|jgi:hypothetical protein